ncbi:HupE/UreJ family protein [Psychrobacter sp. TB55-MNA-CIBAN-0194]|uniref:HupE/UreJ family protein n=1 Tax=Psychrobacter sp. TB55-MNA-CIBAN-0194 TaxID=3140445 RepID=UPI0033265DD6
MTASTKTKTITKTHFSQALSARNIVTGSTVMMTSLMLPSLAQAHSGHIHSTTAHTSSLLGTLQAGLMHPLTGFDHLFLAVGMGMLFYGLQKQRLGMMSLAGGLSLGAVLATVGALVGGAAFGSAAGMVEMAILLSVVVLAFVLMGQWRGKAASLNRSVASTTTKSDVPLLSMILGGLAVFHGMAHAMELPAQIGVSGQLGFYAGMMVSMLGLYAVGMVINQQLQQRLGGHFWFQRGLVVLGLGAVFIPVLT